jgi:hypothetical protein
MNNFTPSSDLVLSCPQINSYFLIQHSNHDVDNFVLVAIILNILVAFLSICGNLVVVYTVLRTPSLRTPANILILGLAISDLFIGVFMLPSFCLVKLFDFRRKFHSYCAAAKIYDTSASILATTSFLTLTAITVDRFLAVRLHLRYQELVTSKRYGVTLACIWVLSVGICLCKVIIKDRLIYSILRIFGTVLFIISLLLNGYLIFKISQVIHRHSVQIQAQQQSVQQSIDMPRYKKSVNTMCYVIGAFVVCYIPYAGGRIVYVTLAQKSTLKLNVVFTVLDSLVMLNSVLNPFIYFWRIKEIRNAAHQLLYRICRQNDDQTTQN